MIAIRCRQARVIHKHEILYSTYHFKELHKINDDFYVIEEDTGITFVYCSTLIMRLDRILLHKIIPGYGVFVYEDTLNEPLGVFYTGAMERIAWFKQTEDNLVLIPQGSFNFITKCFIVHGFDKGQNLILENKRGDMGYWDVRNRKFVKSKVDIVQFINDLK